MKSEGEPYSGVAALFNADLHTIIPEWAPRDEWQVVSENEIIYTPPSEGDVESAQ